MERWTTSVRYPQTELADSAERVWALRIHLVREAGWYGPAGFVGLP